MERPIIGSYRVVRRLGGGGMGTVYLAEHALLGRPAAIKVLLPQLSAREDIVQRFFNEARATTAISDPGIVQIFDFGYHSDGSAFIVMELLEGEPLDVRLRRAGRLPVIEALRIGRQLASSLACAHGKGIIHRDLKPQNVFLVRDPEVPGGERAKVLDFGIAKLSDDLPDRIKTHTGVMMGTPVYMSPEQCRGAGEIDPRSDIYALGCLLFHLLVGRPPFDAEGSGELIAMHLREPAPPPSSWMPDIPPEIDAIILRCLAKLPGERFQRMEEVVGAIAMVLSTLAPSTPGTPWPPATPWPAQATRPSWPCQPTWTSGGTPAPAGRHGIRTAVIAVIAAAVAAVTAIGLQGGDAAAPHGGQPEALAAIVDAASAMAPPPDAMLLDAAPPPPDARPLDAAPPAPADASMADARVRSPRMQELRRHRDRRADPAPDSDDLDGDGIPDRRR